MYQTDQKIRIRRYSVLNTELVIGSFNHAICLCDWVNRQHRGTIDRRLQRFFAAPYVEQNCPVIDQCISQLDEYLAQQRKVFSLPLLTSGTAFQTRVWSHLSCIPYGETKSYLELAQTMGSPKAVRAVANANGANAISILIPCHRVIGSTGKPVGYAGGLDVKQRLLALESMS